MAKTVLLAVLVLSVISFGLLVVAVGQVVFKEASQPRAALAVQVAISIMERAATAIRHLVLLLRTCFLVLPQGAAVAAVVSAISTRLLETARRAAMLRTPQTTREARAAFLQGHATATPVRVRSTTPQAVAAVAGAVVEPLLRLLAAAVLVACTGAGAVVAAARRP
jgi:hypothetical protein